MHQLQRAFLPSQIVLYARTHEKEVPSRKRAGRKARLEMPSSHPASWWIQTAVGNAGSILCRLFQFKVFLGDCHRQTLPGNGHFDRPKHLLASQSALGGLTPVLVKMKSAEPERTSSLRPLPGPGNGFLPAGQPGTPAWPNGFLRPDG